jgi:DNA-binding GntR family transcriptional regulator
MDTERLPAPLVREVQTFSGRTVEVLRDLVVTGRLRPGERLNEVELANALGISRGPLREAIQRLRSEGLLTTIANRGAYVRTFTPQQLRDLYEVRIALETHAVRLAAEVAADERLAELRELLDATDTALKVGGPYPRDLDFHQMFVGLADCQALYDAAVEVHRQIEVARSRSANEPSRARIALVEHREIFDHLEAGRGVHAANALDRHLRSSLSNALSVLEQGTVVGSPAAGRQSPDRSGRGSGRAVDSSNS